MELLKLDNTNQNRENMYIHGYGLSLNNADPIYIQITTDFIFFSHHFQRDIPVLAIYIQGNLYSN